jgi:Pyridine nucleotide-disulphide oxidoreductase, dimerisation domain
MIAHPPDGSVRHARVSCNTQLSEPDHQFRRDVPAVLTEPHINSETDLVTRSCAPDRHLAVGQCILEPPVRGIDVKVGRVSFRANGMAMAVGSSTGLVKLVADAPTGEVLGYHLIGPGATELIAVASLGSPMRSTAAQLALGVYAHPTISESLKEAALAVQDQAIHC